MKPLRFWLLTLIVGLGVAATVTKISQYPQTTALATNDMFLVASGNTNKYILYQDLRLLLEAVLTNESFVLSNLPTPAVLLVDTNHHLNYAFLSGLILNNSRQLIVNGVAGQTNFFDYFFITNSFFVSGKGNTLIVTQAITLQTDGSLVLSNMPTPSLLMVGTNHTVTNVNLLGLNLDNNGNLTVTTNTGGSTTPTWTTLGLSGTNVTGFNPGPGTNYFKLTLTTNAWFPPPTTPPTTNTPFDVTIWVQQDGTGGWTVGFTNASYDPVNGIAPPQTTNANARDVYVLTTDPFNNGIFALMQSVNLHH